MPPPAPLVQVKQLTPLQAYIRHLLLERLDEDSVEVVIKQLRKLPWADPEAGVEDYVITSVPPHRHATYHHQLLSPHRPCPT